MGVPPMGCVPSSGASPGVTGRGRPARSSRPLPSFTAATENPRASLGTVAVEPVGRKVVATSIGRERGRRLGQAWQETMFRTIVVGTDGSKTADRAVRKAVELARLCSARLHVVTAYRPTDMAVIGPMGATVTAPADEAVPADIEAMLQKLEKELTADGVDVTVHAVAGRAADALLDAADAEQADAIVVGNRGVQGSRQALGSVPLNILQHARCAVVVVPTTRLPADDASPP